MTTQDRFKAPDDLEKHDRHTYEAIFRHPAAHNLQWRDVKSLLEVVAEVSEGHNGSLHLARNGHSIILNAPKHKDVATVEDLLAIRRFLEQLGDDKAPPPTAPGTQLLVVIEHREAKVYRTESHGAVPQQLVPYDPHGFGRHLRYNSEAGNGKRRPELKSFYEAIAATLRGAEQILIFGSGTGESSAMEQLLTELKDNHRDIAAHVVGSLVINAHHVTDDHLLAQAREFFASKAV
ncbi:hypothetical protein [Anatilimnocola floriformis]|uniref:hypothetical protein n=1 Tax=Anatilimnocola floriformis TaxID=2948575 RepID=UPI0020C35840|nr:hypothetical protein [Anatilimnocola floriformis]